MKEIILTMTVFVEDGDEKDGDAIEASCHDALARGWQFGKAQYIAIDRPEVTPDDAVVWHTNHRIMPRKKAKIVYHQFNKPGLRANAEPKEFDLHLTASDISKMDKRKYG